MTGQPGGMDGDTLKGDGGKRGPARKKEEFGPDFKHIVRLIGTDLDGKRPLFLGLTAIPGIGPRMAETVLAVSGFDPRRLTGSLSDEEVAALETFLKDVSNRVPGFMVNRQNDPGSGKNEHVLGGEVELRLNEDINLMRKIRCYRGLRHEGGHKVRGQRTRSNGRRGLSLGVVRQAALADSKKGPSGS